MMYRKKFTSEWIEERVDPFDELIVSWNAARPQNGKYLIYVSAKVGDWSPWLLYSSWGSDGQASFSQESSKTRVYQDAFQIKDGKKASGFQIRIESLGEASLDQIYALHVYTNGNPKIEPLFSDLESIRLPFEGLSQMRVDHPRRADLCSPTSSAAVVNYLCGKKRVAPAEFARSIKDERFDIFGNWVLNVAEAAHLLGADYAAWVERLSGFDAIYSQLRLGLPVIASVKGPLPGSALPYAAGHLLVVIGFDAQSQKVLCMDPAFPSDEETLVGYDFSDFLNAWNRRGRIAYMFLR